MFKEPLQKYFWKYHMKLLWNKKDVELKRIFNILRKSRKKIPTIESKNAAASSSFKHKKPFSDSEHINKRNVIACGLIIWRQ